MLKMNRTYIALGSNLNQPKQQLNDAIHRLSQLQHSQLIRVSSFYQSKPLGPQDQPDYVNAVICLDTQLAPLSLLDQLQQIEQQQGRVRLRRWGERTLDLDILLYGDMQMASERLTLPHYAMTEREFVIVPLFEIAPDLLLPDGSLLRSHYQKFIAHQMQILE